MARLRIAALALALLLGLSAPASAFDVGMMDAANSLPEGFIDSQYLAPRSAPVVVGHRLAATDQWNIPVAWSGDTRRPTLTRAWGMNLPTGTNQWNVPLEWVVEPRR